MDIVPGIDGFLDPMLYPPEEEEDNGEGKKGITPDEGELSCCKGRLDAFGNELKLILAEVTIITQWIQQQFGVQLVNQESLLFKHIYDLEEIEEIASGMSFPDPHPPPGVGVSAKVKRGRKVGRPKKTFISGNSPIPKGKGKKKEEQTPPPEQEWNPQDFVETVYEGTSRPRRASTRRVNYREAHSGLPLEEMTMEDSPSQQPPDSDIDQEYREEKEETQEKKSSVKKPKRPPGVGGRRGGDNWESKGPKQCDECGKVVQGTSSLKKHKMMHADERPHPCPECGKRFRDKKNVKIHLIALHNGERHLQCSFCGRKFYAPKDLRIHERTHTGDKPYPCHLCPKRFNVKEHLTMHIRVHTGEKPYVCPTCNKAFSQANSLRIHKKIHLKDKESTPRGRGKKAKTPPPPSGEVELKPTPTPTPSFQPLPEPHPSSWRTIPFVSFPQRTGPSTGDNFSPLQHEQNMNDQRYFYM